MNLIWGIIWGLAAQITTFLQLQGRLKYDILKDKLSLQDISELIIGVLSLQRDRYDYFSEEESKVFDLLYFLYMDLHQYN